MENENAGRREEPNVPDTTQKQQGTTSAFSAASTQNAGLRKQGGTDAEHDTVADATSKDEEHDDTIGIP